MSDSYDPVPTQTTAISFRKLDALQDSVAIYGKTLDGTPVVLLVAADGSLQTRRLSRSSDEIVLIATDSQGVARPVLIDTIGRLAFRPLSALSSVDPDGVRIFFVGPSDTQVQGRADADSALFVADAAARASLASILGRLDLSTSGVRDGIAAAIQATQPRNVTNFPADYPDALAAAHLLSILGQGDAKTSEVRDTIASAIQATQPRSVANFPTDFPDSLTAARLLAILGQLDHPASEIFNARSAFGSVTAAANTGGLVVALDLGVTGRTHVQRFVSAGTGAVVSVQVSRDNATWRTVETLTFPTSPGGVATLPGNGYRYVRITSASAAVALEFEIAGAR